MEIAIAILAAGGAAWAALQLIGSGKSGTRRRGPRSR
jgi:hypothetical protein